MESFANIQTIKTIVRVSVCELTASIQGLFVFSFFEYNSLPIHFFYYYADLFFLSTLTRIATLLSLDCLSLHSTCMVCVLTSAGGLSGDD